MHYSPIWALFGALLVIFTVYDFYITTLTLNGGGPLSKRSARKIWSGFLAIHNLRPSHQLLGAAGPTILLIMILTWFGMCWLGWFMIFCSAETSIVSATTLMPAGIGDRIYYAGYTLTTIGYGDFKPQHTPAQIASIVSGFNGLFLVTLAITYSIPVVSATADRRQLAMLINAFGPSLPKLIDRGYGDGAFSLLSSQLQQTTSKIASVSQKHLAYPVIRYFHEACPRDSLPINLVRLEEAIAVTLYAFPDLPEGTKTQLASTQQVIETSLMKLELRPEKVAVDWGDEPDCEQIVALRYSDKSADEVAAFLKTRPQRRLLVSYVRNHGWQWSQVHSGRGE